MKLLITGATGFLGKHVVAAALSRGHHVRALIRPATDIDTLPFAHHPNCEITRADLRNRDALPHAVDSVDAVIHLAAVKTGDLYTQLAGTVVATENLLDAMRDVGIQRLIAISSFSVYQYLHRRTFSTLDESSPLEPDPDGRDAYCRTKLYQETLIRQRAAIDQFTLTILRPGVIFGKDNLWTARLGIKLSPAIWIRTGAHARLPLTYVENCAQSIVLAAECDAAIGQTFNVVDDHPPTQRHYARLLQKRRTPQPRIIPIAWTVMRLASRMLWLINRLAFKGGAKVPSLFIPACLHARTKPLRYPNDRIKSALNWQPQFTLEQALDRSFTPDESALDRDVVAPAPTARKRTPEPVQ